MAREQAIKARHDRNAALVECMILAAVADGNISQMELQTLLRRVIERPEFEGTQPGELNALVEASAKKLARSGDFEKVLSSLRDRLPDHANRLLAFGLAASVAFADRRATRTELGLLKTFQGALGVSEEEVVKVVEVVERGGSLSDALGDPPERLYADAMVLVAAGEGLLTPENAQKMVDRLVDDSAFARIGPQTARTYVHDAVASLVKHGLPARLVSLAHGLNTPAQRQEAFRLAAKVGRAQTHGSAERILDLLQATLGLADDEVQKLRKSAV